MLLVLIFTLAFASIALLAWQLYPAGARIIGAYHAKRVKRDSKRLERMFLEVPHKKLILVYGLSPVITGIGGFILTQTLAGGLIAAAFGIILPNTALKIMEKNRIRKFRQQLIDGLMIISSSLKGGLSLLQSIEVLVEEMPAPIKQEFALILRENKMGASLSESLARLNKRIKSEELNLVVTAIDIARETGGNLTEPLKKLMLTIRERDKLLGKLKTLTMQAKLQGLIMSFMPIIFGIVVYYLNPGFFKIMLVVPTGRMLLVIAGVLQMVGAFLLWKLSQVEV
ncbi:MAG: type II secretion system F family protein [Candidatus Omnitrophota bacterium]|nr:MAG: type II secretion system F family protein [Candidatus Omnitrophota bacterium]